jgi:hypothetical protein
MKPHRRARPLPSRLALYRQLHFGVDGIGHPPGEALLRERRSENSAATAELSKLANTAAFVERRKPVLTSPI